MATVFNVGVRINSQSRSTNVNAPDHRRWVLVIIAAIISMGWASVANAQSANQLVSSTPADGASLPTAPTEMTLTFASGIASEHSLVPRLTCNSVAQVLGTPTPDDARTTWTVGINGALPKGPCSFIWGVSDAAGGVVMSGIINFAVQSDLATPATTSPTISVPAVPPETSTVEADTEGSAQGAIWLGRVLSTIGLLMLFGAMVVIALGWAVGPEYLITLRYFRILLRRRSGHPLVCHRLCS